jgi:hypothetical protein
LSYISSPFWSGYILEVESCELFPQTGFKPWYSWSQPPE